MPRINNHWKQSWQRNHWGLPSIIPHVSRLSSFGQLGPARQKGPTGSRAFVPAGPALGRRLPRLWFHSNTQSAFALNCNETKQHNVLRYAHDSTFIVFLSGYFLRHRQLQMQVGLHLRGLLGVSLGITIYPFLPNWLESGRVGWITNQIGAGFHPSSVPEVSTAK